MEKLKKQNQGEEGNFVLSKADTELNMKRDVELVLTPFSLDFADHRIQKRLFMTIPVTFLRRKTSWKLTRVPKVEAQ